MPVFGDGVRVAGDIGMNAQTFPLSLTARGFDGIPQAALGSYSDVVREFLGIGEELKLLFGISFGTADSAAPMNERRTGRLPLKQDLVFTGSRNECALPSSTGAVTKQREHQRRSTWPPAGRGTRNRAGRRELTACLHTTIPYKIEGSEDVI